MPMLLSRRGFLSASATVSGGLLLAWHLPAGGTARPFDAAPSASGEINAWLLINRDNTVVVRVAQSEMGQGVFTALPMLVAEELHADWSLVRAEHADANRHVREQQVYRRMSTGGSGAVRHSREYLQRAGAEARERLIRAAAARWGVPPDSCRAAASHVHHDATGRVLTFGAVAAEAATVNLDGVDIALKTWQQFELVGTSQTRLDAAAKVDGSAVFGIDIRLPGMLYAAIAHCPVQGGTLQDHDAKALMGRRGVLTTVALANAVAVVADNSWRAQRALAELSITWQEGEGAGTRSADWDAEFLQALGGPAAQVERVGEPDDAFANAAVRVVEADYRVPYLAHACMEPLNCTVHLQADRADVWVGTQNPEATLLAVADASGLTPEQVHVHNCWLGGGFGIRSHTAHVVEAVQVAKAVGKPVQVLWSREEDTRQGRYRPMSAFRFRAALDAEGRPTAYASHTVTHSILAGLRADMVANGVDASSVEGLGPPIYAFAHRDVRHTIRNTHLATWFWRAVGASQNGWALESFIDEVAHAAGTDPFVFRRALVASQPAAVAVLDRLGEVSDWRQPLPAGRGRGVALFECFGTIVGQVAEVTVGRTGALAVDRVVTVLDCGHVVNPSIVEAQVESSIVYGLTAALYGKITVEDGRVREGNFDTYRMLTLAETPKMETHLQLSRGASWGGVGEPALAPLAAAVCNAIFQATGRRLRTLPILEHDLTPLGQGSGA
ncbi:MAG: molybdopterin cofactor-binding domain-containing protein [Gammaproteobacteria bacterium]